MTNVLMHPPANGATTTINGRTYKGAPGTALVVPDYDGIELAANGWIYAEEAGTTAQRPTAALFVGRRFNDSTVGSVVVWDGKVWRHATTSASV
jgi:hypothetical protein